jgi:hypothetical protein
MVSQQYDDSEEFEVSQHGKSDRASGSNYDSTREDMGIPRCGSFHFFIPLSTCDYEHYSNNPHWRITLRMRGTANE